MTETRVVLSGLAFPEGPRWHDGRFWFSDIVGEKVHALDEDGTIVHTVEVPGEPSGLGWLPDGSLLVVVRSVLELQRLQDGKLVHHASLVPIHRIFSNDMVVDAQGRAYVGSVGYDFTKKESPAPSALALVRPDGRVEVAAEGLMCPNGVAVSADGTLMVVAETLARQISAFDVAPDGTLSNRRIFARIDGSPDGLCLDAENCVWVALPDKGCVVRVADGGAVQETISVRDAMAFACVLGGEDRRTLMICAGTAHDADECRRLRSGRIEFARVAVPGAGRP